MNLLYKDKEYILIDTDYGMELKDIINKDTYLLSYHGYEPCTYIKDRFGNMATMHDGFDLSIVRKQIAKGTTIESMQYRNLTPHRFCEVIISFFNQSNKNKE